MFVSNILPSKELQKPYVLERLDSWRSKNCQRWKVEEEVLRLVAKGAFDKKSPAWLALPREARDREFSGKITEILGLWIDRAGNDGNKSCIHIS